MDSSNILADTQERFNKLPLETKRFFTSGKIDHAVSEIQKGYKLHLDKASILHALIDDVILGRIRAAEFKDELKKKISVDDDTLEAVAKEVNDRVFTKITEELKNPRINEVDSTPEQPIQINVQHEPALDDVRTKLEEPTIQTIEEKIISSPAPAPQPTATQPVPEPIQGAQPTTKQYAPGEDPYRELPK